MQALEQQLLMPGHAVTVVGSDGDDLLLSSDIGAARLPVDVAGRVYATR